MSAPATYLTNARLPSGETVDLRVVEGAIASIDPPGVRLPEADAIVHDLCGWLVMAAFAEPHAHLDKALTADLIPNPTGDLLGAIDAWVSAAQAGAITHDGIVERATAAMDLLLVHGVTAVRSHVNVLAANGASAVIALREAATSFVGSLDLQIVALCGTPMTGPDGAGTRAALVAALEAGADLVGGCPHLDPDPVGVIDVALDAATDAGVGVDLHIDEMLDPTMLSLRDYATAVIERGFEAPTAASHCVTLGMQPPAVQREVATLVAEANMAVFPLPQTNLFLQGREHPTATPRGLTAVRALQEAGALVAAGADNVQDPFNLVGRSDPLETASLMVMAGHQLPGDALAMVGNDARRALGLTPVTFAVGDPADIVAIDAPTERAAIADAPMSRRVFRHGRLVASADQTTTVYRN